MRELLGKIEKAADKSQSLDLSKEEINSLYWYIKAIEGDVPSETRIQVIKDVEEMNNVCDFKKAV